MRVLLVLACTAIIFPGAALAEPPKDVPKEKVICKRVYDADTGSHFQSSKKICRTEFGWDELQRETDEALRTRGIAKPPPQEGMMTSPQ